MLAEHRHRYACWCAARAAQRGWSGVTTARVRSAIEASTLYEVLAGSSKHCRPNESVYQSFGPTD